MIWYNLGEMKLRFLLFFLALTLFSYPTLVGSATSVAGGRNNPNITTQPLTNFAWSGTIGWISFSNNGFGGPTYGVDLLPTDGAFRYLSGYAWSPAIGWIRFDPSISNLYASTESQPPTSDTVWSARYDINTGAFTGWARACGVFADSNCGNGTSELKPNSQRGGWDGWIKFSGSTGTGSVYQVGSDTLTITRFASRDFNNAWGGDIIGWISFCDPNPNAAQGYNEKYCVKVGGVTASCSVLGADESTRTISVDHGDNIIWHGAVSGGTSPYYMEWVSSDGGATGTYDTLAGGEGGANQFDVSVVESCPPTDNGDGSFSTNIETHYRSSDFSASDRDGLSNYCSAFVTVTCTGQGCSGSDCNPSGDGSGTLGGNIKPVFINSQPLTSPAISSVTTLTNTSNADPLTIVIKSITSVKSPGTSLQSLISGATCRLASAKLGAGDTSVSGSCDSNNSYTLPPNSDAFFNIKIPRSSSPLSANSPYRITVGESGSVNNDRSFLFHYNVGTVTPL